MQISFKPITLADKAAITAFTLPSDYKNCDFSFANMCSWRFLYDSCYAVVDEEKCVGCGICAKTCPAGCIEIKEEEA